MTDGMAMCWQVVDELLAHGADVTQALTHGLNNALCVAASPLSDTSRSPPARVALVCITHISYCLVSSHLLLKPLQWTVTETLLLLNLPDLLTTVTVERLP